MKDSVKDRLVAFINAMGLNYTEFGNKIGVSNSYVTSMRTSVSPDKFAKIASAYPQLNIVWLMTGEGEMFNDGYQPETNNVRLFARMIKEVKYQQGLNQQKIADKLGVTRQQLSDLINGRREITEDLINKVYDEFDFLKPKNVVDVENATGSIVTGGDNSGNVYNGIKDKSEKKPIIPDNIVTVPNLDVLDYVKENTMEYKRAKTGKLYSIKIEPEAMEIIFRLQDGENIIGKMTKAQSYKTVAIYADKYIKVIAQKIGIPKISSYWARHTWATIASSIDIPKDTISAALGHGGNTVTDVYIRFDRRKVDEANRKVINYVLCK